MEIEKSISEAKEDISHCKLELQKAKKIRKNKQEYDSLAKVITVQPDREQSQAETEKLKEELSKLEQTKNELAKKLDMRGKQLHTLIHSIHVLQQILDDDEGLPFSHKQSSMDIS